MAKNGETNLVFSRSQWPRGQKHELFSLARTLGWWVRIPFEACLLCVCVVLCVDSSIGTGWSPVQGVLPTVYRLTNWKSRKVLTKGRRDIIVVIIIIIIINKCCLHFCTSSLRAGYISFFFVIFIANASYVLWRNAGSKFEPMFTEVFVTAHH
jgi:hypothetical protein